MFFRREKPHEPSFDERIGNLTKYKFETQRLSTGRVRVSRNSIAAVITDVPGKRPHIDKAGLLMGDDIGLLVNEGYQMFFKTAGGKRRPALADQLHALHNFEEDMKEALGLVSLYNEGLGTTSDLHMYDRLKGRDRGVVQNFQQTN